MKIKVYIKELQYRLFFTSLTFIINTFIIYKYKEQLIFLLGQHQNSNFPHFITTNLPEVFFCILKLSFFLGFYCSFPVVFLQSWLFIGPALYKYEYKTVKKFLILSICLFILGCFFVYKIILPYCWVFFSAFELNYEENGINLQLETRLQEYLNFFLHILYTLNISTNFCLFLCFFLFTLPVTTLAKQRKIIYFLCFLVSTLITPPDIISQIFIGIFLMLIYEFFVFSLLVIQEYKKGE